MNEETSLISSTSGSWNNPPENVHKVCTAFLGFIVMGMFDAALGALLPSFEHRYNLNDFEVSILLLAPMGGYLISAGLSTWTHYKIGRGGLSILGVFLQLLNFAISGLNPPLYVITICFMVGGFGSGLVNGSWNAWIGAFREAHGILGVLQGMYAVGAFIGPAVVTLILEKEMAWYSYYRILAGCAFVVFCYALYCFRGDGPREYKQEVEADSEDASNTENATVLEACTNRHVILLSILIYAYQGTEMSLSDWIVTYMIRARNGDPKRMGLMSSCLWFGLTAGRVGLGWLSGKFQNFQRIIAVYLVIAIGFQLMFWSIDSLYFNAFAIFMVGAFTGPFFASVMIKGTSILPKRLHVPGICAAVAMSGVGAATLPVIIGAMVGNYGAWILQPILFLFLTFLTILWMFF